MTAGFVSDSIPQPGVTGRVGRVLKDSDWRCACCANGEGGVRARVLLAGSESLMHKGLGGGLMGDLTF